MQYSSSLCLFLGLQTAATAAVDTVQPLPEGIEGYNTEPIMWEVPVFPGGENATIAGTVEEVHAELVRRNPKWDDDFPLEVAAGDDLATRDLERRNDFRGAPLVCGPGTFGWGKASTYEILRGISYLRGVSGRPSRGPGPGNCGRVSCSWNSAIWWCNDARVTKTLHDGFGHIADGAKYIVDECRDGNPAGGTVGHAFHPTEWNVIVRKDNC